MFVICWVVKHKVASLVNHSWRRERSGRQKRCSTKSKRFKDFDEIADFFKDSSEEKENEMKTEVADKNAALQKPKDLKILTKLLIFLKIFLK